jgi:hypothetical protein
MTKPAFTRGEASQPPVVAQLNEADVSPDGHLTGDDFPATTRMVQAGLCRCGLLAAGDARSPAAGWLVASFKWHSPVACFGLFLSGCALDPLGVAGCSNPRHQHGLRRVDGDSPRPLYRADGAPRTGRNAIGSCRRAFTSTACSSLLLPAASAATGLTGTA